MKKRELNSPAGAIFFAIIMFVVAFWVWSGTQSVVASIRARSVELQQLEKLRDDLAVAGVGSGNNPAMDLIRSQLGAVAEIATREFPGEGWTVRTHAIRARDVPASALSAFLDACEKTRPRLLPVQIEVNPGAPGKLSVSLVISELVRK